MYLRTTNYFHSSRNREKSWCSFSLEMLLLLFPCSWSVGVAVRDVQCSHNKSYHNKYHYTTQTLSARQPGELIYRCQVTHIHFEYYLKHLHSQLESCSALFTVTQQGKICEKNIPIYLGESHKVVGLDQLKTMKHCTGTPTARPCSVFGEGLYFSSLTGPSSGSETEN